MMATTGGIHQMRRTPTTELVFARGSLIVLGGPSGIGKSTWAQRCFGTDTLVSADDIRAELFGDASIQAGGDRVFRELHHRVEQRLADAQTTVVDITALGARDRRPLLAIAAKYDRAAHFIVLDGNRQLCQAGQASRERKVPNEVIERQLNRLEALKQRLARGEVLSEGFTSVHLLDRAAAQAASCTVE
jgi:protein phosphatase